MNRQLTFFAKTSFLVVAACSVFQYCSPRLSKTKGAIENNTAAANSAIMDSANNNITARRGEVLFLGNTSKHHDAQKYAPWLAISLFKSGVNLTYTNDPADINEANLSRYDGIIIYANHDSITATQEGALKNFVESGKGFIPLHSASGCFNNSDWYTTAVGAKFKSHGVGSFTGKIVNSAHPVMKGLSSFTSWDETYVHQNINPDITVLMERVDGAVKEPYTWVRNQGKGRVFYTAYGHNDSTWVDKGFLDLVTNGVLWAIGDEVKAGIAKLNIPDVSIYPDTISNYTMRHKVSNIQVALSPNESEKLMQVPPGFEVQLFASEPDITNPIAMAWDERGRLWIVESVDYPNTFLETDGASNDRIKICEDTNGDGKADKFTVFADNLNIPTSMVFANGGVVVSMAPYFVFLKDTDGDDKADVKEIILNGWEKDDTHFGPSNLQYGFDNKIWGVVGSGFNGKDKEGKNQSFRTGVYHVNPDGSDLEFLANTSNNTWGLGFSEENNIFISTANNTHSAFYSMPAKYIQRSLQGSSVQSVQKIDGHYDAHTMTPNMRQVDVVGGFTSAAGHHLYTARSFPKSYWNRIALVCEPTVRLLHNAVIEPDGAGFKESDGWNLLASSDEWVGPVHAEVGPDGAVWVADWYNFIIQHNVFVPAQAPSEMILPFTEQPRGQGNAFISPMRDINHGRVYRIVYKNAKPYTAPVLHKDNTASLLAALSNDNMFWRMHAQRLLVEAKNKAALPGLYNIIKNSHPDEIGLNNAAVHALWTLHGLGVLDGTDAEALQVVHNALSNPTPAVRKAALEVMPKVDHTTHTILHRGLLSDADLNVRMNAIVTTAGLPPSAEIGKAIYQAALIPENTKDEWIQKALFAAAIRHQEGFMAAAKNTPSVNDNEALVNRILQALNVETYALPRRGSLAFPPDVTGKEIVVRGTVTKGNEKVDGFIMGQGGKNNGYGLFIQDGKIQMVINSKGKVYSTASSKLIPEKFDFVGKFAANGLMTIEVDGKQVASGKGPALFNQPLASTLRVWQDYDNENKIGTYTGNFRHGGNLQNLSVELKSPVQETVAKYKKNKVAVKIEEGKVAEKSDAALKPITINIRVVENVMKFDKKSFTVKAGQKVIINLINPDNMQHNLVITDKGAFDKVGAAADAMLRDPKAAEKNYVPKMAEVLHATRLLNSGDEVTLQFIAPTQPGDYPYICTFPGHWRIMNGIMKVIK